jgi:hypothetical protein
LEWVKNLFFEAKMKSAVMEYAVIERNVGGRKFTTTSSTLCRSPFFVSLLECKEPIPFIDRNPDYFALILDYLRSGTFSKLPKGMTSEQFTIECDYFLITKDRVNEVQRAFLNQSFCELFAFHEDVGPQLLSFGVPEPIWTSCGWRPLERVYH